VRRGRLIRIRRQVTIAVGLAVVVGAAAGVPGLLRPAPREPQAAAKAKVTVDRLGPVAARGLIGSGTINGKRWRLVAQPPGSGGGRDQCYLASGAVPADQVCYGVSPATGGSADPASFASLGAGRAQVQYAAVAAGVTRLAVTLAGGTVLELYPTQAYGQRYVAFAIPLPLAIDRVTAYAARAEMGYAVPFNTASGDTVGAWLGPGQAGPPRVTRVIGSGNADGTSWSQSVHAGAWGYCLTGPLTGCYDTVAHSLGNQIRSMTGDGRGGTNWAVGTASAAVSHVRVYLSGGRSFTARAVDVGGPKFVAFAIPKGLNLIRVGWYTASGHEITSESDAQIFSS
jgi:hypothetical protein